MRKNGKYRKMKRLMISCRQVTVLVILVSCLAACTESEPQPIDERAEARWNYLIEQKFEEAWEYYSPGFRQTTPKIDFARDMVRRPIRWLDASVVGWECEEEVCEVRLSVSYQPVGAPNEISRMRMSRVIEERWILVDGQWWYAGG